MSCKKASEPITNVTKGRSVLKQPYAYVLTTADDEYLGTYPTLGNLAVIFAIAAVHANPIDSLMRAVWADGSSYFVPHDLIFEEDENGFPQLILLEKIPEHFLERNLEAHLVKNFWRNQELKARGFPEERMCIPESAYNYNYPPECIPKIGWVDEHHPLHSANKGAIPKQVTIRTKKARGPAEIKREIDSFCFGTNEGNVIQKRADLINELGQVIGHAKAKRWFVENYPGFAIADQS